MLSKPAILKIEYSFHMVSSRVIDSEGKMLEGVPLGPVDSYIHSWLSSAGISIESFLGKYTVDRYASVTSVVCR